MGKKFIIELPENTHWIQWLMEGTEDHHPYMDFKSVEDLTPYTAPDLEQVREEAYLKGLNDGQGVIFESTQNNVFNNGYKKCLEDMDQVRKETYQQGLSDAWEAARKILHYGKTSGKLEVLTDVFSNADGWWDIINRYTASEAIEKLKAYEQEQETDGLRQNIQTIVDQCGYSLDEIATVLEKMREGQDE